MNKEKAPLFRKSGAFGVPFNGVRPIVFYLSQTVSQDVPQVEHVEQLEREEQDAP